MNFLENNNGRTEPEKKGVSSTSKGVEGNIESILASLLSFSPQIVVSNLPNIDLSRKFNGEVKEILLPNNARLLLIDEEEFNMSVLVNSSGEHKVVHISKKELLKNREEFNRFEKENPYFEGILSSSSKYPLEIFKQLIIQGRVKALETGKIEEVLKYFLPDGVLKGTKDAGYLFGENIGKYFEDFLKLNPKGEFVGHPAVYMIGHDLIVVVGDYNFELDGQNGERIVKPAQYMFVLQRVKGGPKIGRWGIKLLHSSFKS